MKRILAALVCLAMLISGALAEVNRYDEVFDPAGDEGNLTVRFLWLGPQVADDKPGDSMILTSPERKALWTSATVPLRPRPQQGRSRLRISSGSMEFGSASTLASSSYTLSNSSL